MSNSVEITMRAAVERGMRLASVEFAREVIGILSREGALTCSLDKALGMFDFDTVGIVSSRSKASKKREKAKPKKKKAVVTAKPSVLLPFCGTVQQDWCNGVKFNHGLHTQCTNGASGQDTYCKTCRKHADSSATGKPPYGDINDRAKFGVDYRDPKGKLTVPYANVVEKLSINMVAAHDAANALGWTIPPSQLVKREKKRGRPTKSAAVSDTESEDNVSLQKPEKSNVQEDQIAKLVAKAYKEEHTTSSIPASIKKEAAEKKKAEKKLLKEQEKLAKKEAAEKLKAEKKLLKEQEKLAKKEAAEKLKAEKLLLKEQEKLVKKQAAEQKKAEKKLLKEQEKLAKKEAADKLKAEKKLLKEQEKLAKKEAADKLKAEKKQAKKEAAEKKKAEKKLLKEQEKLAKKEAVNAPQLVEEEIIDEPWITEEGVIADEETLELGDINLSETMEVGGVEYYKFTDEEGNVLLFTTGENPTIVGVHDAETDTIQTVEFEE